MTDLLRIYVLWHPNSAGRGLADRIASHFDGLGMERDGVSYRVPVRFRSVPWDKDGQAPRAIDLGLATHNAIVLLHDPAMSRDDKMWDDYVQSIRQNIALRGQQQGADVDCYIPFQANRSARPLSTDEKEYIQYARQFDWKPHFSDIGMETHALLHILSRIRTMLQSAGVIDSKPEPLFVSHAKLDGDGTARAVVTHIGAPDQDVPLTTFYDVKQLVPGQSYEKEFREVIGRSTLLAIVSDIYDSRPWCVFELTQAKRARRPIVLADIGKRRISRTFPYGANVPRVKLAATDSESIERLLLEVLSEGLRCDLFLEEAGDLMRTRKLNGIALPRPPELFDIVARPDDELKDVIVYPDPPLSDIERELVEKALQAKRGGIELKTLGELR